MICALNKCGKEFDPALCGKGNKARSGRQRYCSKKCQRHAYYAANPERYKAYGTGKPAEDPMHARDRTLRRKYGIGCEEYDRLMAAQGGRCAICGGTETHCSVGDFFAVDHDHATGRVRGLLCGHCNRGLGMFRDEPRVCANAAMYLSAWRVSSAA